MSAALAAVFLSTGCAYQRVELVTPDENYGVDAVAVWVTDMNITSRRLNLIVRVDNHTRETIYTSGISALLEDSRELPVPVVGVVGADLCPGCSERLELVFDISGIPGGVAELQLAGLPGEVAPILLRLPETAPAEKEEVTGEDIVEVAVGVTVVAILVAGWVFLEVLDSGDGCLEEEDDWDCF